MIDPDYELQSICEEIAKEQEIELCIFQTADELRRNLAWQDVTSLVIDLENAPQASLDLQRELLLANWSVSVIATTGNRKGPESVTALELGAIAVLDRPWSTESIKTAIRVAVQQARQEQDLIERQKAIHTTLSQLTPRQQRVLELAGTGLPNKLIAANLDVSQRTVEAEKSKVLKLFDAPSYPAVMVMLGESQILDELSQIRRRLADYRVSMFDASASRRIPPEENAAVRVEKETLQP